MGTHSHDEFMRFECCNFECNTQPRGFFMIAPLDADEQIPPLCSYCNAPMVREDVMATNTLLWELGLEVAE